MQNPRDPLQSADEWSFACHLTAGEHGTLAVVTRTGRKISVSEVPGASSSGLEEPRRPVLIGLDTDGSVLLMDPLTKAVTRHAALPADAIPAYAYIDGDAGLYWMVNDGDKESGVDTVQCGSGGSPIIAVRADAALGARIVKTLCIGRGHHVTIFSAPSARAPKVPRRIFSSNLMDGTLTVIGNDPADAKTYLNVIDTVNLCDASHEDGKRDAVPNNAYPHGMAYSPLTGKVYNMNNGYGTVAVIDPITLNIEATVGMKTSSNLLLSPDGRFLVGKGADRKSDPEHVIGRLSIMDGASNSLAKVVDLPDVYPSVYRFSADGRKLYVTTAATGKGRQKENLKLNSVLVFDSSALPELRLIKEVKVGRADCSRRPIAFITGQGGGWTFVPNPSDGTLSILDGDDNVVETVTLGPANLTEINFSFWRGLSYGA